MSLRAMSRLGATFSLLGTALLGSSLSLLDFSHLGASLALRSVARYGSALSVFDFVHLGSTLSVRGIADSGSNIYCHDKLQFDTNTYLKESSGSLVATVGGNTVMTLSTSGGTLHGMWTADTVISVSDRRLKSNIKELVPTLEQNRQALQQGSTETETTATVADGRGNRDRDPLHWVLRQLRPVSYSFKAGSDAKNIRFGFIADEMEKVLPQVVRELPQRERDGSAAEAGGSPKKGIVYPDLIAVLTAMMRDFGSQLETVKSRVQRAEAELDRLDEVEPMHEAGFGPGTASV
jgi:hypothetical protein